MKIEFTDKEIEILKHRTECDKMALDIMISVTRNKSEERENYINEMRMLESIEKKLKGDK